MMPLLFTSLFAAGGVGSPVDPAAEYQGDDITGSGSGNSILVANALIFRGYELSHTGKIVALRLHYVSVSSAGTDIKFGIYHHDVNLQQPTLLLGSGENFVPTDGSSGVIELPLAPSQYIPVVSGQVIWIATLFNAQKVTITHFDPADIVARRTAEGTWLYATGMPDPSPILLSPGNHSERMGVKIWTNAPADPPPVDPVYVYAGDRSPPGLSGWKYYVSADVSFTQRYITGFAGQIVGGRLYVDTVTDPTGGTVNGYLGFYSDNAGLPNTLLAQVHITIPDATPAGWLEWSLDPADYINVGAGTAIYIACIFDADFVLPRPNTGSRGWSDGYHSYDATYENTEEYADGLDSPYESGTFPDGTWAADAIMQMKIWTNA